MDVLFPALESCSTEELTRGDLLLAELNGCQFMAIMLATTENGSICVAPLAQVDDDTPPFQPTYLMAFAESEWLRFKKPLLAYTLSREARGSVNSATLHQSNPGDLLLCSGVPVLVTAGLGPTGPAKLSVSLYSDKPKVAVETMKLYPSATSWTIYQRTDEVNRQKVFEHQTSRFAT